MLKLLKAASPEDLFVQRYDLLMGWALALTGHNQAQAEDLVHDAFIQFTLRRSDLGVIENTDAYLNRMLRNMHLSQIRRTAVIQDTPFSIANFDSAEIGLRSIDPRERVDVQDDLRRICRYACARKASSKVGCVLILRFFHGYYPSEIAEILRTTRKVVDRYLSISRRESKLYLSDPTALKFIAENPEPKVSSLGYVRSTPELLAEVRQTIFESCKSECIPGEQLKEFYKNESGAVELAVLSHVVSCARCLDAVNTLLGLPPLAERNPDDRLGRDVPPDSLGGGRGGEGGSGPSLAHSRKRYQRRLRETVEHRPQELRIAVNGFVLGSQQISSEFNKQVLSVNVDEPIGFIEVFSEQGLRLLFFDVDQPIDGSVEQTVRAEFDRGRALELSLSFRGPWPTLNVSYHDPTFEAIESFVQAEDSELPAEGAIEQIETPLSRGYEGKWSRPAAWLRALLGSLNSRFFLRPGTVTAVVALLLIAVLVFVRLHRTLPPVTSAADLLQRSTTVEEALAARTDQVLHRTISLEERRLGQTVSLSAGGELIARHKIEIWQSAEKGIIARRLYDEKGSLIAGDWRRSDGVETLYQHGKRPQLQIRSLQSAIRNFDSVWQLDPSAKEFTELIGNFPRLQVQEATNTYTLSYQASELAIPGGVVSAILVMGRSDLHVIQQTLVVRQGGEVREYRFVETSFERRSPNSVAPAVFEPDALLVSERMKDEGGRMKENENPSPLALPRSPVVATPELELQVLEQLNQANAFYGEQISLSRTSEGRLTVEGIVESDRRKAEILQAVGPLKLNPALQIQIETVAEATQRQARQGRAKESSIATGVLEVEAKSAVPAEAELRRYLARQRGLSGEALDQEIRRFDDRVIGHARQARRHAVALKQIAERFSADDLHSLDENARNQWRVMLAQHARAAQQELEELRWELQPVFPSLANADRIENFEINADSDLARAAKRLFELTTSVDEAVGRSFSIYASGAVAPVKTIEFSRSLHGAAKLARNIASSKQ